MYPALSINHLRKRTPVLDRGLQEVKTALRRHSMGNPKQITTDSEPVRLAKSRIREGYWPASQMEGRIDEIAES